MLQREVYGCLCRGPLVEPMGTGVIVLEKGEKCIRREARWLLGSPAPIAQSSWPLVMWSTSYPHQHMDLPTITKGAQNHKHGPFHSSNTANTVFVSYSMSWVSSICYFLILLLKVWLNPPLGSDWGMKSCNWMSSLSIILDLKWDLARSVEPWDAERLNTEACRLQNL